jgi:excisionase family DNA binding protein
MSLQQTQTFDEAIDHLMVELSEYCAYSAHLFDWIEHHRRVGESIVGRTKRVQDKRRRRQLPRPLNGLQDSSKAANASGLLMIGQAAAYLGITDDQVAAFVQDGELGYINLGRGKKRARYRFTIPDLQDFIERRRRREVLCRSTSPKGHRTTTSTSRPEVIGFMAARAAQLGKKPKPTKR